MRLLPLPTFLIIGAQKSATRWLRSNLGRHPDIFTAEREIEFFNHHFHEGTAWYRRQFEGWAGEPIVGEATPGYGFHSDDPLVNSGRVRATLGPDARIIAILRDPVDRARSAYLHHLRNGNIDPEADPVTYLRELDPVSDPLGLVSGGWYARSLQPYRDRFGDGLHVAFHEDARTDPYGVVVRAGRHVGLTEDWAPDTADEVTNAGAEQLSRALPDHPALALATDEIRPVLSHHFVADTDWLEVLLERPVPWRAQVGT